MINFKKKLLYCISLSLLISNPLYVYSAQNSTFNRSVPTEQLNIRISKDNYSDFHESLILNFNNKYFGLNKLYYSGFNFNTGNLNYNDIIRSSSGKRITSSKSSLRSPNNDPEQQNIFNVNIAQSKITANNVNKSNININPENYVHLNYIQLIDKSNQAYINKQMYESRFYLDQALSKAGNNPWTLAELANKYEKLVLINKANSVWNRALVINNNRLELLYSYSLFLIRTGQNDKACVILTKIIKYNPKFMLAYYNLGNLYFQKNQYIEAIKAYYKAIQINPYSEDTYYNLGLSLEAINQKKLASIYYKECLRLNPSDKQAKIALKRIHI